MSPTTQKFGWKDRDTAARDLLQLVYHAPESISERALELLSAIRSPAVVPELLEIFRDEQLYTEVRALALKAIALTPVDIYLPELRQHLPAIENLIGYHHNYIGIETLGLVKQHPSNQDWLSAYQAEQFAAIDGLPPIKQFKALRSFSYFFWNHEAMQFPVIDRLLKLIDAHPELLDLDTVSYLHLRDHRPSTQAWFAERWKTLEYLCLAGNNLTTPGWDAHLMDLLEDWGELKQRVFDACPSFIPEYELKQATLKVIHDRYAVLDFTKTPIWCEMEALYRAVFETGDLEAGKQLWARIICASPVLEKAVAAHFLGELIAKKMETVSGIVGLLNESSTGDSRWSDHWIQGTIICLAYANYGIFSPIRFELGATLQNYPQPNIWKALINAYLYVARPHCHYFLDWIAYQTDRLSGLEVEYTGATLAVEDRPWFRELVEREKQAKNSL